MAFVEVDRVSFNTGQTTEAVNQEISLGIAIAALAMAAAIMLREKE